MQRAYISFFTLFVISAMGGKKPIQQLTGGIDQSGADLSFIFLVIISFHQQADFMGLYWLHQTISLLVKF